MTKVKGYEYLHRRQELLEFLRYYQRVSSLLLLLLLKFVLQGACNVIPLTHYADPQMKKQIGCVINSRHDKMGAKATSAEGLQ